MNSLWSKEDINDQTFISREGPTTREGFIRLQGRRATWEILVTPGISLIDKYPDPWVRSGDGITFLDKILATMLRFPNYRYQLNSSEGYGEWIDILPEDVGLLREEFVCIHGERDAPEYWYDPARPPTHVLCNPPQSTASCGCLQTGGAGAKPTLPIQEKSPRGPDITFRT